MKTKKLLVGVILTVGLILVNLQVSFAKDSVVAITSPLTEPVPSIVSGSTEDTITLYYVVQWNNSYVGNSDEYELYEMICKVPHGSGLAFSSRRQQTALWSSGGKIIPYTVNIYNIKTGILLSSKTDANFSSYGTINGYSTAYGFRFGYFPEQSAGSDICAGSYPILPDGIVYVDSNTSTVYNSTPFVSWSAGIPDQISYKSPLSEPVADQYNSYAVLDDRLIWISYRVNAMYTRSNQIESSSQVFSSSVQYSESGTGSYAGQQNGYTEDVSVPDGMFNYWSAPNQTSSGVYRGFDLGNIDFSGVNSGSIHFNSNGSVTYNDVEYRPISFNQSDILSYFRLYCIPTASDNFVFWLAPDHSFSNDILINMDFFFSEFDLDGNYIRSSFNQVTSTELGLFDAYQPEDPVSSVRFYGINFYNLNNLPLNLSSVLWQYDFDFETWRNQMFVKLSDIYNLLANAQDIPETTTFSDWHNELNEAESDFSDVSPDQVMHVLKNSFDSGDYGSAASRIRDWVNDFSIPEVITLCVFALALGTVTLTLGKKKSE